jgi:hypothetical protein
MRKYAFSTILIGSALTALLVFAITPRESSAVAPAGIAAIQAAVAEIAKIQGPSAEETNRLRNAELNQVFQQYTKASNNVVSAETIREFNALVKQNGMSCFDNFYEAMLTPLRYVTDPKNGERVPVFGALGSDIINPWLAAMGVSEGLPLDEQPMYKLASEVLREQLDFAVIGTKDPNLTFDLLPPELHENARWAYARLNPTNKFEGGFDQPLFYITIREAAKKLFREDHPTAKMTMADVVLSEDKGGLGINSCLLCHERDYTDVYGRLLGQSYFYQKKITEHQTVALEDGATATVDNAEEVKHAEEMSAMFQLAANRVLEMHRDKIDIQAASDALESNSADIADRLLPGFDEFYETLDSVGCTMCHSTLEQPSAEHNPAKFNAFVLTPNNYFKTKNVKSLVELIDPDALDNSKLLNKASGKVKHRGAEELKLDDADFQQLKDALYEWVHSLDR